MGPPQSVLRLKVQLLFDLDLESDGNLVEESRLPCEETIYTITPGQHGEAIVQLTNGAVLKLKGIFASYVFED